MTQLGDFERQLIQSIADSFGMTYEQLTAEPVYTSAEREAIERSRQWHQWFARQEAIERARWNAALAPLIFSLFIDTTIPAIVGYNPHRLLESPQHHWMRAVDQIAYDLNGTCQSLEQVLEKHEMEGAADYLPFCHALDALVFECIRCNWWFEQSEMAEDTDDWVCTDCVDD